jgi:hypothetical protein
VKRLLAKINLLLITLCSEARRFLRNYVEPTVKALQAVKRIIDSPIADGIVKLTRTEVDNLLLAQVRIYLPIAIVSLDLPVRLSGAQTLEEQIKVLTDYLRTLPKDMSHAVLAKLATLIAQLNAQGTTLKESEIDLLVHLAVQRVKHGAKDEE